MIPNGKLDSLTVLRAIAGDREALTLVLIALDRPLYSYILKLVLRPETAEDLLQEVLYRISRKLYGLRDPDLIRPWAFRIASRECFRELRRTKHRNEEEMDLDLLPLTSQKDTCRDWEPRLLDWVDALPPASRSVIVLHYLEEMTLEEIAEILEISPGTVKSRLFYGLAKLRKTAAGLQTGLKGRSTND